MWILSHFAPSSATLGKNPEPALWSLQTEVFMEDVPHDEDNEDEVVIGFKPFGHLVRSIVQDLDCDVEFHG